MGDPLRLWEIPMRPGNQRSVREPATLRNFPRRSNGIGIWSRLMRVARIFPFLALFACGGGGGPDTAPGAATPPPSDLARLETLVAALPAAADDAERRALVDAFFIDVAYTGGFPIREGGRMAVALYDERQGPFAVAGDFDGWDAAADPLTQPVAGFGFYYRILPVAEPLPRTLYKFTRAGTDWFADPWARRYGSDAFGQYSLAEAGTAQSHLERWPRFAQGVGALEPRNLAVYVPAGAPLAALPVLYMQDGQNLFLPDESFGGATWRAQEAADAAPRPILLVGVYNTAARMDEYTQVPDDIGGGTPVGGRADEYVAFLVSGVKPFIDARYPTDPGRTATAIAGSLLGGLVSVYAAYRHPEVFGRAGAMSGTFGWGGWGLGNPTLAEVIPSDPPLGVAIYLDSGGGPGSGCPLGGDDNYCETVELADVLRGLGWQDEVDLVYRWEPGAWPNETAWAARLPGMLAAWY